MTPPGPLLPTGEAIEALGSATIDHPIFCRPVLGSPILRSDYKAVALNR